MFSQKGHSLADWTIIFAVVLAGLFFFRTTLKRTVVGKVNALTDHFFWMSWGDETEQYKGDELGHSMSVVNQQQDAWQGETKNATIMKGENSFTTERSVSTGVEEGFEDLLETLEPADVLNQNP